jgi:hypothetical protein
MRTGNSSNSSMEDSGGVSRQCLGLLLYNEHVNRSELARPLDIVQELSEIKAIVVGRVAFGMVGGRYCAHFVPVD